jgi:hypothetical protein
MTLIVSCLAAWMSLVRVERQSLRTPDVEDGRALRRYREPGASRAKNAAHPVFDRTSGNRLSPEHIAPRVRVAQSARFAELGLRKSLIWRVLFGR